jgi:hypothetical protein
MSPKVAIKTLNGDDTLMEFNAFDTAHADMLVSYCDAERAEQEIGTGNVVIIDNDNLINKDHIKSVRVELSFAKPDVIQDHVGGLVYDYDVDFIPFLAYESEAAVIRRPKNYWMEYLLSGPSTKHRAADLMLLMRKATKKANNPDYGIANLVIQMFKARKARPLNDRDIDDIWNISADLVSEGGLVDDDLNKIYYTVVNEVFTTLYDFIERMASITGAEWDIEYTDDFAEMLQFKYPDKLHSGVRVKSIDLASATDNKLKTSYIMDGFEYNYNASSDANIKTTLYTTTVVDQTSIAHQMSNQGFTDLSNKAIAQQIQIEDGDRRINALAFIMSKIGNPSSRKDRVNCDLVLDDSANRPIGQVLASFNIPLDDIKTTPDTIFVDLSDKVKIRFLEGSNKIWVRMFQRSGVDDSDPNTDILNTIRWHHDGIIGTAKTTYSATAAVGDYKTKETLLWNPLNTNATYTYTVFSKLNRLLSVMNQTAAKRIGVKEAFIDTSQISIDPAEINRFMSFYLSRVSKPRISTSPLKATIPNNFIFKPYMGVSFEDSFSNIFADLRVQRARITVSALSGDNQSFIGAYYQELTLGGAENSLTGDCTCG